MTLDPATLASAIESAPSWALVALTVPQRRLREDARYELAQHLISALSHPDDRDQLPLPL